MNCPTPDFSTQDLWLKSPGLGSLELKSLWLKSLVLKRLGLKSSWLKFPSTEKSILGMFVLDTCELFISKFCQHIQGRNKKSTGNPRIS